MAHPCFAIFSSPLGDCGIVWHEEAVTSTWLPADPGDDLAGAILARHPQATRAEPDGIAARAVEGMLSVMAGARDSLIDVPLDLTSHPPFDCRVWVLTREVLPGQTAHYGDLATRLDLPGAARAVGRALGRNPFPVIVPCHRVLAAGGRSGGFSAPGGVATKRRLLEIEGGWHGNQPALF